MTNYYRFVLKAGYGYTEEMLRDMTDEDCENECAEMPYNV
jgi:hypothetical protein